MEYHKAPLPTLFSVGAVISFFRIRFGERHFGGDWHNFPELLYVEEGEHHILVDGEPFLLRAGEAILYAPNAYHIGPAPSRALVDIVSFDNDFPPLYSLFGVCLGVAAAALALGCGAFALHSTPSVTACLCLLPDKSVCFPIS